jgi:hypothetical protein
MSTVLVLILAACGSLVPMGAPVAATPEDVLRQVLGRDTALGTIAQLQMHGTRTTLLGEVLLFTATYHDPQGTPTSSSSGYLLVERHDGGWIAASGSHAAPLAAAEMMPVVFTESQLQSLAGTAFIAYGWTKTGAEIATVEVVVDTGHTLRDTVTDGMFAVTSLDATVVCELRAYNSQGQMVYDHRSDPTIPGTPPNLQQHLQRCGP